MSMSSIYKSTTSARPSPSSPKAIHGLFGYVWERLRYDWSEPGVVKGTVEKSNLFKPGSTWEIRATPTDGGGSHVEILAVRHLSGIRGRLLTPLFPLGLAKQNVADHLRHFLTKIEESETP